MTPNAASVRALLGKGTLPLIAVFLIAYHAPLTARASTTAGMVAWWTGDDTPDELLNGIHGTLMNGAGFTNGLVGSAFRLNGSSQYVSVPDNDIWTLGSTDFTVELWVRFNTDISGRSAILIGHDNGGGQQNKWFFGRYMGNLLFHINSPTIGPKFFPQVDFRPTVGEWYHLAVTRRGSTYTIFVNGSPAGSANNSDAIPNPSVPLTIGHAEGIGYVNGHIDEVSIYHRALSPDELQSICLAGAAGKAADFVVTSVAPQRHGNAAAGTLTIRGLGLSASSLVTLTASGTTYTASQVALPDRSRLTAKFDFTQMPATRYTLRITEGTHVAELPFDVVDGSLGTLETKLILPSQLGYHMTDTIYVEVTNPNDAPVAAPVMVLTATQGGNPGAFLGLDQTKVVPGFWTLGGGWSHASPDGFAYSAQFIPTGNTPGSIEPGETIRVPVYYIGWDQPWDYSYSPIQFTVGSLGALVSTPVNWAAHKDEMRPPSVPADAWEAVWANFLQEAGTSWADYQTMLLNHVIPLGCPIAQMPATLSIDDLLAFAFAHANALNIVSTLASSTDAQVPAPGLDLTFSRTFKQNIISRYRMGAFGRGWAHNWDYSLAMASDGSVTITGPGGSIRTYQADTRTGGYFSEPGDYATLTSLGGGAYRLQETDGTKRAFRADGKLNYLEDPNGNRITAGFNGNLLTGLTHSGGQSLVISNNAAGLIAAVTDPVGRQTTFTYDAANQHLVSARFFDGTEVAYTYSAGDGIAREHALTRITYPSGSQRHFAYDTRGRLQNTHATGGTEPLTFTYGSAGAINIADAFGSTNKFTLDHRGQLVKAVDPQGNAVAVAYDAKANPVNITDPAGKSYQYVFDSRGNLTKNTDPLGFITQFRYDGPFNRLTKLVDARANATQYSYDSRGNLTAITYPDGAVERWSYDSIGNPVAWTNRRTQGIAYQFNTNGQLTAKVYPDASRANYEYDTRGNLVAASNYTGAITLAYDPNDRLQRITYPGNRWLDYTYDAAGRRATMTDQLGYRLSYFYDGVGRLQSLTNSLGETLVQYTYDAAGRLLRKTLGNGVYTTYGYDLSGHILTLTNALPENSVLSFFNYAYDSRGRRTAMSTHYGAWTYDYDDIGQLTHAVLVSTDANTPSQDLQYVYDALGNRTQTVENGVTNAYTANNLNQYTQVGDKTYTFDPDGNLIQESTSSGTLTYTYDSENRLISVASGLPGGWSSYQYDAFGNRAATAKDSPSTHYVVDPAGLGNVVGAYDDSGNRVATYDYGLGLISEHDHNGDVLFHTFDALGSTHEMIADAGIVVSAYVYSPFGAAIRNAAQAPQPFMFVGEHGVMTPSWGPVYMRARYMSPRLGRFLCEDPLGLAGGDVNSLRYVLNKPTAFIDPSGLWIWEEQNSPYEPRIEYGSCQGGRGCFNNSTGVGKCNPMKPGECSHERAHGEYWARHYWDPRNMDFCVASEMSTGDFWTSSEAEQHCRDTGWSDIKPITNAPVPPVTPDNTDDTGSTGSADPNEKIGPTGVGTQRFLRVTDRLSYQIKFENLESAGVPAQIVTISDPLSACLDWTTFEIGEIAFGDHVLLVPAGTSHFTTAEPMSQNGTNFVVEVNASINTNNGQVQVGFYSINPDTGLPPPLGVGFLPPNLRDANGDPVDGRGEGHVKFTIKPKSGLSGGTVIRNVAHITFDGARTFRTNLSDPTNPNSPSDPEREAYCTIDAGPPVSTVATLGSQTNALQFNVAWSGQDEAGGAGITGFDVYVSDNGGAFTLLLGNTTQTNLLFTGQHGHTYMFYTIARDSVGNEQTPPVVPNAATMILLDAPTILGLTVTNGAVTLTCSGLVPTALYSIQEAAELTGNQWTNSATIMAVGTVTNLTRETNSERTKAFYRLKIE